MSDIRWNLLQPVDTGAQVLQGFKTGAALVKGSQTRSALGHYLANPDDPHAYGALAYLDPQTAAAAERQHILRQKAVQDAQDRERAVALGSLAATDPAGAREEALRAGDFDLAKTFAELGEDRQKKAAAFWQEAGPLAYRLRQIDDPEARRALYEQAKPMLAATGADPALINGFDPTNDVALDAAITTAQKVGDLVDQARVTWHQQGEQPSFATNYMGIPVGTQNPYARGGVASAASAGGASGESRGLRNNNPLNVTLSEFTASQPGYAGTDEGGRYARFETPEAGMAAASKLLGSYLDRGFDTPAEIIGRWASEKENGASTANYVDFVSKRLGIAPGQKIGPAQIPALMEAMADFENGSTGGEAKLDAADIRAKAAAAIAKGADPAAVRARAKSLGVEL
jgi:hypothetical protein